MFSEESTERSSHEFYSERQNFQFFSQLPDK